ncbi:MAG: hypothetical protein QOF84_3196 [Streptomyces sp.]|nr:hypothetical protein [Streptomyces sp.]
MSLSMIGGALVDFIGGVDRLQSGCHAVVVWWDLERSRQTISSLKNHLLKGDKGDQRDLEQPVLDGLRLKTWTWDQCRNRWGAVFLWESKECVPDAMSGPAGELIGYPPTDRWRFDVVVDPASGTDVPGVRLVLHA